MYINSSMDLPRTYNGDLLAQASATHPVLANVSANAQNYLATHPDIQANVQQARANIQQARANVQAESAAHPQLASWFQDFQLNPQSTPTNAPPGVTVSTTGNPSMQSIYSTGSFNWDTNRIIKKALKYLLEGLAVATAAHFFGKDRLSLKEIIMIGITAAFVFAILDIFSPEVSFGARTGAGFAIGYNALGFGAPSMIPVAI
jgi:hypothetical protein